MRPPKAQPPPISGTTHGGTFCSTASPRHPSSFLSTRTNRVPLWGGQQQTRQAGQGNGQKDKNWSTKVWMKLPASIDDWLRPVWRGRRSEVQWKYHVLSDFEFPLSRRAHNGGQIASFFHNHVIEARAVSIEKPCYRPPADIHCKHIHTLVVGGRGGKPLLYTPLQPHLGWGSWGDWTIPWPANEASPYLPYVSAFIRCWKSPRVLKRRRCLLMTIIQEGSTVPSWGPTSF